MTDVRKVLTTLVPRAQTNLAAVAPRNQYRTHESDKVVLYNSHGFLELDNPPVHCPMNVVSVNNEAEAKTYSYESVFTGPYLNQALNPIHSSVISPYRTFLIFSDPNNRAWTFPDLLVLIAYMRDAFPGMLIGGLSWTFTVVNNTAANTLTLNFPAPATTGTVTVFGGSTANSHVIPAASAVKVTINILSTAVGSEYVSYIIH